MKKNGFKYCLLIALLVSLWMLIGCGKKEVVEETIMETETVEETEEVIELGVHMLQILALGYIAMAVTQSLSGVMRGAGDTLTPMWISFVTTIVIRMPLAYGIAYLTRSESLPNGTPDSVFISLLIAWVMGAVLTSVFYRRGKWRKNVAPSEA